MTEAIPGPYALPFIGNILDLRHDEGSLKAFERLAEIYGPIYQVHFGGKRHIVCSSAELMAELTDEKYFVKTPPRAIANQQGAVGLFAAQNEDPDWGQAHRILVPAFGPLPIGNMFDEMKDIASQLVLKWARKDPEKPILVTDDFTRLTLDTIALCSMDFRFNSFYQDSMHPFVGAMLTVLSESGNRVNRPAIVTRFMYNTNAIFETSRQIIRDTTSSIIKHRRENPSSKKDFLNAMLYGKDPKTGEVMRDELIGAQMSTFLIAGHETTSGLLSFVFFNLLKNPRTYLAAQDEVDKVIGRGPIAAEQLNNLKYINAILRETSRLYPTAPIISKKRNPNLASEPFTIGNGKYVLQPDDKFMILLGKSQRDVDVYGEDALEFKPERMLDEEFEKLPTGAWRPFGNGVRACIGRGFAWQEALLVLALILQNFDIQMDDPSYQLHIKQTLTVKPKDFFIKARLREGISPTMLDQIMHSGQQSVSLLKASTNKLTALDARKPMNIIYGSNTGTCQALAQRLATEASGHGFQITIQDMNSVSGKLPNTGPLVIITASYEGQPPDNAARFIEWLTKCGNDEVTGVQYAVFGCGHRDWAATFHRIPKLTDATLAEKGACRLAPIGLTDAAKGNIFGDFDEWTDSQFWPAVGGNATDQVDSTANVEISTSARASSLRHDIDLGKVKSVRNLTTDGEPLKLHMEIQLPSGSSYECGDYLAVLPMNPEKLVRRVLAHFQLPWDATINFKENTHSSLPTGCMLSVYDVLRSYVELSQPATKKDLKKCSKYTTAKCEQEHLEKLCNDDALFSSEILTKRTSLLDILAHNKSCALTFGDFLLSLPPMRVRQYSISSSPLVDAESCSITFSVIDRPSLSDPEIEFEGVASTYLSTLQAGDRIQVSIRPTSKKLFRLPPDLKTPFLMYCAGSGIAPFRGFIEQRAMQKKANPEREITPAVLFVGCRSYTKDRLYAEEIDEWVKAGVVEVFYAFSKEKEKSHDCAYVAEAMHKQRDTIASMWHSGARAYVCGSRAFAESVGDAASVILSEGREVVEDDEGKLAMEHRFKSMQERIATDIFD